jgi:hypothetical protein
MGIIKNYHDKKWTLQFLDALYNSIDYRYRLFWHFTGVKYKKFRNSLWRRRLLVCDYSDTVNRQKKKNILPEN